MSAFRTIGIVGKQNDARAILTLNELARLLLARLAAGEIDAVLAPEEHAAELASTAVRFAPADVLARSVDLLVVVGGDGTLLGAGRRFARAGVPILGVNQGRLGFMVDVRPEDMGDALAALQRGESVIEERLMLEAQIKAADGREVARWLAVNDVVLRNQASIRMLEFETWLDDEFISQHRADGFIVSTPTGSTAYALSGGGPVMHPSLDAIALVPICPHTLSDRPIVVPAGKTIRIVLGGDVAGAAVTCDGQTGGPLSPGQTVEIAPAAHRLRLIHPQGYSYFALLRDKLHWGRSPAGLVDKI
jgi:NAD+ kinase